MKEWRLLPGITEEFQRQHPEIDPVVLQLLANRGLKEAEEIRSFFEDSGLHDPFLFRNMAAAVDLVISHIKKGNKIVVYGDYDADGVTSSVILLETLNILHGTAEVYLPDRVSEGYGLNRAAINSIAEQGFKLIITVDTGIRNKEEIAYAKKLGLDVIVTDHHVLPEEGGAPDCIYIDPADPKDGYPWKFLAGVGVSFKLISALLERANLSDKQKKLISEKCLDLVAVGTVADMVSLLGENRRLVKEGLKILNQKRRLGLNELIKGAKVNGGRPLEAWNIGWQIGPRLNAASRLAHANSAFALLTTADQTEAEELASELNQRNVSRQQITEQIMAEVEAQIDPANLPLVIIGVAGEEQIWNEGVIGLVAGRIAEKYYRPTLIITRLIEAAEFDPEKKKLVPKKVSFKGSGRSVEEFNLIAAIEKCSAFLDKFGGHPMACGFFIKEEANLKLFREKISSLAAAGLDPKALVPKLKIEAPLEAGRINLELADKIAGFAPFGQYNPQPRFVSYGLRVDDIMTMGCDNQHIKLRLSAPVLAAPTAPAKNGSVWALAFGCAQDYQGLRPGDRLDLVYHLEVNEYNGRREPQLKIVDWKACQDQDSSINR